MLTQCSGSKINDQRDLKDLIAQPNIHLLAIKDLLVSADLCDAKWREDATKTVTQLLEDAKELKKYKANAVYKDDIIVIADKELDLVKAMEEFLKIPQTQVNKEDVTKIKTAYDELKKTYEAIIKD